MYTSLDFKVVNGILTFKGRAVETDGNSLEGTKIAVVAKVLTFESAFLVNDDSEVDSLILDIMSVTNTNSIDASILRLTF